MSQAAPVIRVLLADDHPIVRKGLRALLAAHADIEVVAEADDGTTAVAEALRCGPDVAVMDLSMPGMHGVEAATRLREACPSVRVLVLSMHGGEEYVRPALRAGVRGYLVKGSDLADLVTAVRAVAGGDAYFSPSIARILLDEATGQEVGGLTPREREVLQLVAQGRTSGEIAQALQISVKTVEGHRAKIMDRLNIRDVPGLVRYAIRAGLVALEP